ncbi:MAG: ABC transporter permease [Cytophagaceae bacterium]|jgi:ABC-2 type transport system permease protein|nr:ABC transporter permease [Cytophagaceae bacterium]
MSKISLILKREYITRVKKKSFIIMTFLTPVLLAFLMFIPTWIATMEDVEVKTVAVIDYTGLYEGKIADTELLKFLFIPREGEAKLRADFPTSDYYGFLIIEKDLMQNPNALKLYSEGQVTMDVNEHVNRSLRNYLKDEKLKSLNIEGFNEAMAELDKINVNLSTVKISDDGTETQSSTGFAMAVSMFFAFLSYMVILLYGSQVFNGVREEKTSRIVEVLVSSVKPFELMMGKITGIALVALTQFFLWIVLTVVIMIGVNVLTASNIDVSAMGGMNADAMQQIEQITGGGGFQFNKIMEIVNSFNPIRTVLLMLFYFVGGYLIYAALYAAVGSAVDSEADSQQFMMPITIPIMIAFFIAFMAFRNPSSSVVFWGSLIPFTSPIVMMSRIPYSVPAWEIILSMVLLVAGFIFTTWFAARIYRTGILMYGKKVDYKELWKWFRYSGK